MAKTNRDELSSILADNLNKKFKGQAKVAYFLDGSEQTPTDLTEWVSTGDDMLDLAISNRPNGGFQILKKWVEWQCILIQRTQLTKNS